MFTSMTARVSTNTYCLARTRRFSRRSENSVGRVTHECEAPTDTVQLLVLENICEVELESTEVSSLSPSFCLGRSLVWRALPPQAPK